jgi:hypothetical protein
MSRLLSHSVNFKGGVPEATSEADEGLAHRQEIVDFLRGS